MGIFKISTKSVTTQTKYIYDIFYKLSLFILLNMEKPIPIPIPVRVKHSQTDGYGLLKTREEPRPGKKPRKSYEVEEHSYNLQELGILLKLGGIRAGDVDMNPRDRIPTDYNIIIGNVPGNRITVMERLFPLNPAELDELRKYMR
jgi:hypothetical protein